MITPGEIKEQCLKWWKDVLVAAVDEAPCFPKAITRIGKIGPKDILNRISAHKAAIELLRTNSKAYKKNGYTLITAEKQFDKIGKQTVPEKISIDSLEDYLKITGKEKAYQTFLKNLSLIRAGLPLLLSWVKTNPTKLIEHDSWADTLKVCRFFLENPAPNVYIRQLPIDIHTKYIATHKSILQSLLDELIPEHVLSEETKFELRYHLKYAEPLIRIRFLDPSLAFVGDITDISLPLSAFEKITVGCSHIFVAENILNFLTLPALPKTIALWSGGGFSVGYLKNIDWIKPKQFFYWGDVDAQGFQILHQFRTYFPNTIAVMMDEETLSHFSPAEGTPATKQALTQLTESEQKLYAYLQQHNIRLEQEKITQVFAEEKIASLFREPPEA
jgi:hypothetical protein